MCSRIILPSYIFLFGKEKMSNFRWDISRKWAFFLLFSLFIG